MKTIVGKVVVLGPQGVGKTATILRYTEKSFNQHVSPTIGASFFSCNIPVGDVTVKLQVWDTAGQERFKAMAPMFYRNASAALLVFDITSYSSFESVKGWVYELRKNIEDPVMLFVVGNKIDLSSKREVTRDEARQYAKSIGATYLESSAKTDQGVGMIFENIAHGYTRLTNHNQPNNSVKVYDTSEDLLAKSSQLEATDTAVEETVNISINSIAHGKTIQSGCC